jgi:hypothetical protein
MKFWIMLILGLLVVSMSVNAAKNDKEGDKDDSNDSDASNDGNNSGAEDGDTSDSTGKLKFAFFLMNQKIGRHSKLYGRKNSI